MAQKTKQAFALEISEEEENSLTLDIYDSQDSPFIGAGRNTADVVLEKLNGLTDKTTLNVRLYSSGGDVEQGMAIYTRLAKHPGEVIVDVDLACSIASVIAMSGSRIRVSSTGMMMLHEPAILNGKMSRVEDLEHNAKWLDQQRSRIANVYSTRTGIPVAKILEMMAEETWLTPEDAVAQGFATEVIQVSRRAAASVHAPDLSRFNRTPQNLLPPAPTEEPEMKSLLTALNAADETSALLAINKTKSALAEYEALAGATGATALGTLRGWKEKAEQYDAVQVEAKTLKAASAKRDFEALIKTGKDAGKLSLAMATFYEAKFTKAAEASTETEAVEDLKGFLAVAGRVIPDTSHIKAPAVNATSLNGTVIRHEGKTFVEMSGKEKASLIQTNPDLFESMREDAKARGQI